MKKYILKLLLPSWILEMAEQIKSQPSRCTAHPFWQVRCKRSIVTEEGYNDTHWVLVDGDGEFFRSDSDEDLNEILLDRFPRFCAGWEQATDENFLDLFDIESDGLPDGVTQVYCQDIEEIVSTHLTQHDAEWFIKRKQHDYPPLYTYVESAYWSPQIKQLQSWLVNLV